MGWSSVRSHIHYIILYIVFISQTRVLNCSTYKSQHFLSSFVNIFDLDKTQFIIDKKSVILYYNKIARIKMGRIINNLKIYFHFRLRMRRWFDAQQKHVNTLKLILGISSHKAFSWVVHFIRAASFINVRCRCSYALWK